MASVEHLRQQGAQQNVPQSAGAQPGNQSENDPIYRFKLLLPRLKESLVNLMKIAGTCLHHNSQQLEDSTSNIDAQLQKFEKSLEEFYSMCDQVEISLRLALENSQLNADTVKYIPVCVNVPNEKGELPTIQRIIQYPQYQAIVRQQIHGAKELHDLLLQFSQKITAKT
ncbi:mediator of RNA polymerase II transcription subunit 29-like [Crassostrea virginica]|uniref:Mediator of RNA polymerase II transcription subunit 29 n=1 Tax=Crassostrea virginica TaxID=6565 RepID=A0A8B8DA50_CRAVI|nr:mediator of RNA polymerase II transcription subunit 29-like [Crassostrea virginica]XP_022334831.1 mediator of RNA polymerase II transcription subunit 29-like [Crassostrea virginica]